MRARLRPLCTLPRCQHLATPPGLLCTGHWDLVPRHLQQALEVSWKGTASFNLRVKAGPWYPLALEAVRVVLARLWLGAFPWPGEALAHLEACGRCRCQACTGGGWVGECGNPACAALERAAHAAIINRRYVDASEYLRVQGERAWSG